MTFITSSSLQPSQKMGKQKWDYWDKSLQRSLVCWKNNRILSYGRNSQFNQTKRDKERNTIKLSVSQCPFSAGRKQADKIAQLQTRLPLMNKEERLRDRAPTSKGGFMDIKGIEVLSDYFWAAVSSVFCSVRWLHFGGSVILFPVIFCPLS